MTQIQKLEAENRQLRATIEKIAQVTSKESIDVLRAECEYMGNNSRLMAYVDTVINVWIIVEDTLKMIKVRDESRKGGLICQ